MPHAYACASDRCGDDESTVESNRSFNSDLHTNWVDSQHTQLCTPALKWVRRVWWSADSDDHYLRCLNDLWIPQLQSPCLHLIWPVFRPMYRNHSNSHQWYWSESASMMVGQLVLYPRLVNASIHPRSHQNTVRVQLVVLVVLAYIIEADLLDIRVEAM
jgi:hypothetical protein